MSEPLLCAVLLPSRARAKRCRKSVESLEHNASGRTDYEILIRLDDNDPQLAEYHRLFDNDPQVRLFIGPRLGYNHIHEHMTDLAKASTAPWVMQWNDDTVMWGPWLAELAKVSNPKTVVVQETHKLGTSTWRHNEDGPFPILPNFFWRLIGSKDDNMPNPADKLSVYGCKALGWPTHYLPGVGFNHQRDDGEALERHRKM